MRYTTRLLDGSTWAEFAELTERNNGVYGGCPGAGSAWEHAWAVTGRSGASRH